MNMNMNNLLTDEENTGEVSNSCPICLGVLIQPSYLDICFHKFCYNCIVHWAKVVWSKHSHKLSYVKCPLCKTENFSIIHGYDETSFQQHYINLDFADSFILSREHKYRLKSYYLEPGFMDDVFKVQHYWKSCKFLQPNRWLQSWLVREIQALLQEEDVDVIVHHVLGVTDSFFTRNGPKNQRNASEIRVEFKALVSDAARMFLTARTDRFVNEMELFLASGLTIEAYDEVYMERLGWNSPAVTSIPPDGGYSNEHTPVVPYLYIFDEDSDGTS